MSAKFGEETNMQAFFVISSYR